MADIYMHSRLTEKLIQSYSGNIDQDIAFLASQGPDPMYYKMTKEYTNIADDIHRYDTAQFMQTMVNYVKDNPSIETKSFLFGFISHYAMDVKIHPYIYYHVGQYDKDLPETYHMRGLHLKFERSVDCLLIQKELGIPSRKMNLTKKHFTLKEAPQVVNELMAHTLNKQFKITNGYEIYDSSVKVMYKVLKYIVTDRFGIKKQLYKILDMFNKTTDLMKQDLSMFHHLEKYDYHNDSQKEWKHPITGEVFTKTVQDLFEEAYQFASDLIQKTDQYLSGEDIDLNQVFTNLSFNTGVDCSYGMDFAYLDIYRKK
jgi:hypothetical protein